MCNCAQYKLASVWTAYTFCNGISHMHVHVAVLEMQHGAKWCRGEHTRMRFHGLESDYRLFSHPSASGFSKLRQVV